MKRLFLIIFILVFPFCNSFAQQELPHSLLWEISGKGLEKPSYLLGTFHMVCQEDLKLEDKVVRVVEAVEQLALEVNLTDPNEVMNLQELMYTETSLSSQLNEQEVEELRTLLRETYQLELEAVDHVVPIGLLGLMASKAVPCQVKGYDMEVLERAIQLKKEVIGLEHFKDQIEVTNQLYSAQEILAQLKQEDDFENYYKEMAFAFFKEDVTTLYSLVTNPMFMTVEARKLLLDNRNANWLIKMKAIMPTTSTLFAVGAGHLGGEQGVIQLLKNNGFIVKPILN